MTIRIAASAFVLFSMLLASGLAQADSFDIIRDGKTYRCENIGNTDPGGAVRCVDSAYAGPFTRDEAFSLCQGAWSEAPATCAKAAYAGPYSKQESIDLCRGATSNGPIDCASRAYAGPFSKAESLQLCSRNGSAATADCAIRAYAGPYTKEQAIQLCRNSSAPLLNDVLSRTLGLKSLSAATQKAIQKRDREEAL